MGFSGKRKIGGTQGRKANGQFDVSTGGIEAPQAAQGVPPAALTGVDGGKGEGVVPLGEMLDRFHAVSGEPPLSAEQVEEWEYHGVTDPDQIAEWSSAGFEPGDAAEFLDSGVETPEEALAWEAAEFDAYQAGLFLRNGVTSIEEAKAFRAAALGDASQAGWWIEEAEIDKVDEVRRWARAGFEPDEAVVYQRMFAKTGFTPEEYGKWHRAGMHEGWEPKQWSHSPEPYRFALLGVKDFETAMAYKAAGVSAKGLENYREAGIDGVEECGKWAAAGIDGSEASYFIDAGVKTAAEASEWTGIGVRGYDCSSYRRVGASTPEEAAEWRYAGFEGRDVSRLWFKNVTSIDEAKRLREAEHSQGRR